LLIKWSPTLYENNKYSQTMTAVSVDRVTWRESPTDQYWPAM